MGSVSLPGGIQALQSFRCSSSGVATHCLLHQRPVRTLEWCVSARCGQWLPVHALEWCASTSLAALTARACLGMVRQRRPYCNDCPCVPWSGASAHVLLQRLPVRALEWCASACLAAMTARARPGVVRLRMSHSGTANHMLPPGLANVRHHGLQWILLAGLALSWC